MNVEYWVNRAFVQHILQWLVISITLLSIIGCAAVDRPATQATVIETNTSFLPTLTAPEPPPETATLTPTGTATATITQTPSPTPTPSFTPFPTLILDQHGAAMVLVPAGEFQMGSDSWSGSEKPVHKVYLDSYYIDQFEVSNMAFVEFLNEVGNQIEGVAGKAHWVEENDPDLRIYRC